MEALKERLCEQCGRHEGEHIKEEALIYALKLKHGPCVEELIAAGADVNWDNRYSRTPLITAAETSSAKHIRLLLQAGADVNGVNGDNCTALMAAAYEGNAECVNVLLKAGADVNRTTNERNFGAILGAAKAGSVECTELLIAAGADVNIRHLYERSAIVQAVKNEYPDVVKILLEAGANVNDTEYGDSWTVLMRAAHNGNDDILNILIKAGADVNRVYWNCTALKWAAECYKEEIETPPSKYKHCLEMLIAAGADVNATPGSVSALIIACRNGFEEGVSILMKAGADINMIGDKGLNPLMEAATNGHVRCAELILEAGIDVNFQNIEGLTALMCVGSGSPMIDYHEWEIYKKEAMDKRDYLGSAKLLLRSEAKINFIDTCSRNALQHQVPLYSGSTGSDDICLLLYAAGETLGRPTDAEKLPECLRFESLKFNLKHLCREAIRKHLLSLDPHTHLFDRIPQLGLPSSLAKFLLYDVTLQYETAQQRVTPDPMYDDPQQ